MSDDDYAGLIARLRDDEWAPDHDCLEAATAIETLLKERDEAQEEAHDRDEAHRAWKEERDRADDLQAKYAALNEEFAKLEDELAAREKELILAKASADGAGSLLLDVQQDCIKEKARADALEKRVERLTEALAEIEVKQCENHAQTIVSMRLTARAALATNTEDET